MKKLAFLGAARGLGIAALLVTHITQSHAADHLDSPGVVSNPMADINDVYTWMDGTKLNLAMTVSPVDTTARAFGPAVQYVFHVHSKNGIGVRVPGTGTETRVICTFASNTSAQCWVVDAAGVVKDYVTGDPSSTAGLTSISAKVRMFAGQRSDPFFFNLQGFREASKIVRSAGALVFNNAGCPTLASPTVAVIRNHLATIEPAGEAPCPNAVADCFANLDVKVILVQVEKTLVNTGPNFTVGVWASTHQGS